ncbi:MAG: hypothetical protein IT323_04985, partial [Anaerolineae bacterium]|nr:hypothetical protein [Anaerolineae bacterium]
RLLVEAAEPLAARAEDRPPRPDEPFIRRPQAILRRAWLSLLHGLAVVGENVAEGERLAREADGLARALVARLGGAPDFGAQFEAVVTASDGFRILAAKLPEDPARRGLVVRGLNPGDGPAQVAVRPWRRFALAHVLGLDETPTGGALAVDPNGAIRFRAAPGRIVSFLFTDEPLPAAPDHGPRG